MNWGVKPGHSEQPCFKAEQFERHLTTCISYTESPSQQTVPTPLDSARPKGITQVSQSVPAAGCQGWAFVSQGDVVPEHDKLTLHPNSAKGQPIWGTSQVNSSTAAPATNKVTQSQSYQDGGQINPKKETNFLPQPASIYWALVSSTWKQVSTGTKKYKKWSLKGTRRQ